MRIGFDFDGTITKNPAAFKVLIESLFAAGHELYLISGSSIQCADAIVKELNEYEINHLHFTHIILKPEESDIATTSLWKYNIIDKNKIRCFYENRRETSAMISELCTVFNII